MSEMQPLLYKWKGETRILSLVSPATGVHIYDVIEADLTEHLNDPVTVHSVIAQGKKVRRDSDQHVVLDKPYHISALPRHVAEHMRHTTDLPGVVDDLSASKTHGWRQINGAPDLKLQDKSYRFESFETLPQFSDRSKALEFLQRLATDVEVRAVMRNHRWRVGKLSEMYPEGQVGISDVCILVR